MADENVAPHDIALLLCDTSDREVKERTVSANPIPVSAKLRRLKAYRPGSITVDTVARLKGLERAVVILWALDDCSPVHNRETLYVGMSRAKSLLYLCGTQESCKLTMAGGKSNVAL